jgi:hypothetical protein
MIEWLWHSIIVSTDHSLPNILIRYYWNFISTFPTHVSIIRPLTHIFNSARVRYSVDVSLIRHSRIIIIIPQVSQIMYSSTGG